MRLAAMPTKAPAEPRIGQHGEKDQGWQSGARQCAPVRRERVPWSPLTVGTAALLVAYFLGLDFTAAAVLCGLGFVASMRRKTSSSRF